MTNSNSNSDLISQGALIWWTGIIVSDETWNANIEPKRWKDSNTLPGWGARYKVRIFGRHSAVKEKQPDDKLELCEVIFPVTAGSGHAGSWQSSNLRQGSVVVGFYKDGIEANEPIIMGCIGNNDQTVLAKAQKNGFDPFTAFKDDIQVPWYNIVAEGGDGQPATGSTNRVVIEANTDSTTSQETVGDVDFNTGKTKSLAVPSECEVVRLATVSVGVKNLIKSLERDRAQFDSWRSAVLKNDFSDAQNEIVRVSQDISGGMKNLIGDSQKFVLKKINNLLRDAFVTLNPTQEGPVKTLSDFAQQEIVCLFRKVLDNMLQIVGQFLAENILKYINVPLCAAENIIGTLLGKIVGFLQKGIQQALKVVESIVGVIDLGDSILGFIQEILEFSFCDPELKCPDLKEWDMWKGTGSDGFNIPDPVAIISKAKSTIGNIKSTSSDISDFFNADTIKNELDISTLLDDTVDTCNVGPILCGPPRVEIFGGGGTEAAGNAIVSATGQILGVDITNFGFDFKEEPFIKIVDDCGRGTGAVAKVLTEKKPTPTTTTITRGISGRGLDIGSIEDALGVGLDKEKVIENATVNVRFKATREFNSGTFFQFKIPGERSKERTIAGRRQFSISTADIKKNKEAEFTINMAAEVDYAVEGFFNLSKEKLVLGADEKLTEENTGGARGKLFDAKRRRVTLGNKQLRIENYKDTVQGYRGGSTLSLDDISLITLPPEIDISYTNLSAANTPILYKKEDVKNFLPGTNDEEKYKLKNTRGYSISNKDDVTETSLKAEVKHFLKKERDFNQTDNLGNNIKRNSEGKKLFFRDAGGNNINGMLVIEDDFNKDGIKSDVSFSEDGRSIVSNKPNLDNVFYVSLLYKDGLEQEDRIFDSVRIGKKDFTITSEEFGYIRKRFTIKKKRQAFQDFEQPDGVFKDLRVTADKGYFYFNKLDRKYYFRVALDDSAGTSSVIGPGRISSEKYNIRANKTRVKTLDQVVFTITTSGISNGTEVYWVINPKVGDITSSDFEFSQSGNGNQVVADTALYGKVVINNNQAKITKRINKSASVGDAFSVTLSKSIKDLQGSSQKVPSPETLTESQTVTVVDDITSGGDVDLAPPLPPDITPVGIGSTALPLVKDPEEPPIIDVIPDEPPPPTAPEPTPPPPLTPDFPPPTFDDPNIGVVITGVLIVEPGIGYTYAPPGDSGGDDRVWCESDETCWKDIIGNYGEPIRPERYRCFSAGDTITLPVGTIAITEPRDGIGGGETIIGGEPYTLKEDGCLTTPKPEDTEIPPVTEAAINDDGYPVDLCLCDIIVDNPGFGYTENDTLVIEPSNGTKASFKLGPFGSISEIVIQEIACGFKEMPKVTIQSETGRNVKLLPKFCIDRVPVDTVKEPGIFEEFITVIDCVGRVPEQDFFRIPD